MPRIRKTPLFSLALALGAFPLVLTSPHGGDGGTEGGAMGMTPNLDIEWSESFDKPNYFRHPSHVFWIYSHIISMVLAWFVLLPIGVMFSVVRSRYTAVAQFAFFAMHACGLFVGTVYNANTPDLYENNAHHKTGWIFTWISAAWILIGIVNSYARVTTKAKSAASWTAYQRLCAQDQEHQARWSDDSGHGTDRNTASLFGSASPASEEGSATLDEELQSYSKSKEDEADEKRGVFSNSRLGRFLSRYVQRFVVGKTLLTLQIFYGVFERTLLILGFVALTTGFVTYGGIFRGGQVFSGLAHFIKGGIFVWVGILTVGRWAGAFADLGWAWNTKPPAEVVGRRKFATPSAEFFESALICLYGASNVWLEHLTAWGEAWSPMDYEHVSITVLFFGGGLLGMLIESKRARDLLNAPMVSLTQHLDPADDVQIVRRNIDDAVVTASKTSLNPLPALTILLLGLIISAHDQHSVLASTMHSFWGALFALSAAARIGTYALHYVAPPRTLLPARPPTELLAGFGLVAGGVLFMASPKDVIDVLDGAGGDAMVAFTVGMGLTAVVCTSVVGSMAVKGWAVRREMRATERD